MSKAARTAQRRSNQARRRAQVAARRRRLWIGSITAAAVVIAAVVLGLHFSNRPTASPTATPAVGQVAPGGTLTTISGATVDVVSLRGHPTLLWFVSTWCSSCQAGTQTMAQNIAELRSDGVRVYEVELYRDLDQTGPPMTQFSRALAGPEAANPDWTFGTSSEALTRTYDPQSYLDIYYLLDANGRVTYVNSSPGSTMPQLLAAARRLA